MKNQSIISQEEWEEVERYLAGEMSRQEVEAFEKKLETDALLQEKVAEAQQLITGIREASLQLKMDAFHQQLLPQQHTIKRKRSTVVYWLAAASILLVLALATLFLFKQNENEKLFARYFEADSGLATAMSTSEEYVFNRGMIEYKTGNYKGALVYWRTLLQLKPGTDTLHYFTGVAQLAINQTDSAIHHLQQTVVKEKSHFRSDAAWFLALALIKENKRTEAITYLKQTAHPKKDELLSQLK